MRLIAHGRVKNNRNIDASCASTAGEYWERFRLPFLAGLEQHLPRPIGSYFDLIAGTSTAASSPSASRWGYAPLSFLISMRSVDRKSSGREMDR